MGLERWESESRVECVCALGVLSGGKREMKVLKG